jgi:hypothetical protein
MQHLADESVVDPIGVVGGVLRLGVVAGRGQQVEDGEREPDQQRLTARSADGRQSGSGSSVQPRPFGGATTWSLLQGKLRRTPPEFGASPWKISP